MGFYCPEFDGCERESCAYPGEEACYWQLSPEEQDECEKRAERAP